jgi:hypothetical protein
MGHTCGHGTISLHIYHINPEHACTIAAQTTCHQQLELVAWLGFYRQVERAVVVAVAAAVLVGLHS